MSSFLTVCVPTYNRARYLGELLASLSAQIRAGAWGPEIVSVAVSDNGSPDATPEVLRRFAADGLPLIVARNERNLGINPNLCAACEMARGRYAWLLGDDELLDQRALERVLAILRDRNPGLLLLFDTRYPRRPTADADYATYREFAADCARRDPGALTEHTLLSSNVFRTDCYDAAFARASLATDFPHMFGLIRGLRRAGAPVHVPVAPLITTRKDRPPPPDGRWVAIDEKWIAYMRWLREELDLPDLDPYAPTLLARRAMMQRMLLHPIDFARNNWRSLFRASAWRFLFDRLFLRRR